MLLLIKNCTVVQPDSRFHGKKINIFIKDGRIEAMGAKLEVPARTKVWDLAGCYASPGWLDVGTQVGDPGFEHREDIVSASAAAAFGGFTGLACWPNTEPAIHSKSEVLYLKRSTSGQLVEFFPIGAISHSCEGMELTEMHDMHHHGAVAFSDGLKPVQNSGLMQRALLYVKAFDGLIINRSHDLMLSPEGQMHEGKVSTSLGLKGIPALAEELMVQRDIYLADYADSRLHIANVSSARSVDLIRQAKSRGLKISASVAAQNLVFQDKALQNFDVFHKVLPPLRESEDTRALVKGIKDGTIDFISSNHVPVENELKDREFYYAKFGSIMLATSFALIHTYLSHELPPEKMAALFGLNPRRILGLPLPQIKPGSEANLTFYDPVREWTYLARDIRSKSKNTPFLNTTFKGKVKAVVNRGQCQIFD